MTHLTRDADTITLRIPFRVAKRGGRKEMVLPGGTASMAPLPPGTEDPLIRAIARAFRWKRMLETGAFTTVAELAAHEGIAPSYMTRVLRLTLLAPEIVEAILDGTNGPDVTLARVLAPFPLDWTEQADHFGVRYGGIAV